MVSSKLLAVVCAAWTAQALVLGARQDLADSPLGVAFPNPPRIGPLPSISVVFTTPTPTPTPTGTLSSPSSGVTSDPLPDDSYPDDSSPGPETGTPTDMPPIPGGSTAPTSLIVPETDSPLISNDPLDSNTNSNTNRTLVITLSSVLSSVGLLLLLGAFFLLYRLKTRGRKPLFARGRISPIDDDEIATWKVPHHSEKFPEPETPPATAHTATHTRAQPSTASSTVRKPPSAVIVYSNPHGQHHHHRRCSSDDSYYNSPPTSGTTPRKMSFDKMLPQTPIQARAPNAIPGLTDESVPGAMPFVDAVPPQGQRRLSKVRSGHHVRARSSRSGSFGGWEYGGAAEGRRSHDYVPRHQHWRMGSASEMAASPRQQRGGRLRDGRGRGDWEGDWVIPT